MWSRAILGAILLSFGSSAGEGTASPKAVRLFSDPVLSITPLSIAEGPDGLLWLAAEQGLFCFDGKHFHQIGSGIEKPSSVVILSGKAVVVAAHNGIFQYVRGDLTRLSQEPANGIVKLSDNLVLVHSGSYRRLEAGSWDGQRMRFHTQKELEGTAWLSADGFLWLRCGAHPCSVSNTPELRDAVRAGDLGLYKRTKAKALPGVPLADDDSISFLRDSRGSYLVRENFSGTVLITGNGTSTRAFRAGNFTMGDGHPGLHLDRQGRVWIPGDYLWVMDGGPPQKFNAPQIEALRVNTVFEDSRGRIWFGLSDKGLAVLGMDPVMEIWSTPPAFGEINGLIRQNSSLLYAVTSKGVILRKNGASDWMPLEQGGSNPPVSQLAPGPGSRLMGLIRVGPPAWLSLEGKLLRQIEPGYKVVAPSFKRLVRGPNETYFIGTIDPQGLFRLANDRVEPIHMPGNEGSAQDIVFDEQGRALVAFEGGVCRVDGLSCVSVLSPSDGLLSSKIRGVHLGAPGEIWVAYRDQKAFSLFRSNGKVWVARHFTTTSGFEQPETQFLRRDRRGWIWRGTENGVWVSDGVHVEPSDWIQITEADGLPSAAVSRFGFLEDSDGTVWIGTAKGIAHIHPNDSWFTGHEPVRIAEVRYGESSFSDPGLFPAAFSSPKSLSAQLVGGGMLPFHVRLKPLETEWRISRTGEVRYPTLGAGDYQLEATYGRDSATSQYAFRVTDPAGVRIRMLTVAAVLVGGAVLFPVALWWKRRSAIAPRRLPDLSAMRLEALVPEVQGLSGATLDRRFRIGGLVASGAFGSILDARDVQTFQRCAIKVFPREIGDDWLAKRFQQEVAALEAISHPNVVRILGHGTTPTGLPYLVMEFIEGSTLRDLLQNGGLPPAYCGALLRQLGLALQEIHTHHIYHRDLKPENVMVRTAAQAGQELVLIDFSMAIIKDPDRSVHGLSRAAGTLHYMAPEQAVGHAGPEADIYSLAKVLIEMLTGQRLALLLPDAILDLPQRVREMLASRSFGLSGPSIDLLASAFEFAPYGRPRGAQAFAEQIATDLERSDSSAAGYSEERLDPYPTDSEPGAV
jgi:ligand-binding sensor domain-containing protein